MVIERLAQVRMDEKMSNLFDSLKEKLNLKNDSEVLRQAITFTEKNINKGGWWYGK